MTNRRIKKMTVFLMAVMMVFIASTGAWAISYIAGDDSSNTTIKLTSLTTSGGHVATGTLQFYSTIGTNVTAPITDATISNSYQLISGTYALTYVSNGIYSLGSGTSNVSLNSDEFAAGTTYMTALATALTINFLTNTITWGSVTSVNVTTAGLDSTVLQEFATDSSVAFTSFTFEENSNESAWLSGTKSTISLRYSSELTATPEPEEWALMLIGLALMGYYLHRKGLLNLQFSPQTYA